jgi:hypothetical protein
VVLTMTVALVSCAKPPQPDIDAAHAKIEHAHDSRTATPELLKLGDELDAEINLQASHFFKSYQRTAKLCKLISDYQLPPYSASTVVELAIPSNKLRYCPCCGKPL